MGTITRGAVALALGAAIMSTGVLSAYAQSNDGQDSSETLVAAGTLADGQDLLPVAKVSIDQAVQAAQGATSGAVGEVDLEHVNGQLAYNVDVGGHDVKVD